METIIRIKKNKSAFKALIKLAKELEKTDHTSIFIIEVDTNKNKNNLIEPTQVSEDPTVYFSQLSDFPSIDELRKQAWPKIS